MISHRPAQKESDEFIVYGSVTRYGPQSVASATWLMWYNYIISFFFGAKHLQSIRDKFNQTFEWVSPFLTGSRVILNLHEISDMFFRSLSKYLQKYPSNKFDQKLKLVLILFSDWLLFILRLLLLLIFLIIIC